MSLSVCSRGASEFMISSRAKRACSTWTASCLSQLQNSVRYKSLYEYMLGVRQWRHVALRHGAFCNIDFAADDQCISCVIHERLVFIHLWNNVYNRWITSNFPFRWHRTTNTASGWKSSIFNRNSSGECRLKFIASEEDDGNKKPCAKHREHRLAQRRQRRQHSDRKRVQRQRQNNTITLEMKRGNTDCRRFKKGWGDQITLTVHSKIIFSDTTIHDLYIARLTCCTRASRATRL